MAKLVKCTACSAMISNKAKSCPTCGQPQKNSIHGCLTVIVVVLVFGWLISYFNPPPKRTEPTSIPSITISAADLYAAYEANEVAADQQFKGVNAIVTGEISDIKTTFGTPQIFIATKWGGVPLICNLSSSSTNQAASLSKGQPITVKGRIIGKSIAIGLVSCTIEQ